MKIGFNSIFVVVVELYSSLVEFCIESDSFEYRASMKLLICVFFLLLNDPSVMEQMDH